MRGPLRCNCGSDYLAAADLPPTSSGIGDRQPLPVQQDPVLTLSGDIPVCQSAWWFGKIPPATKTSHAWRPPRLDPHTGAVDAPTVQVDVSLICRVRSCPSVRSCTMCHSLWDQPPHSAHCADRCLMNRCQRTSKAG